MWDGGHGLVRGPDVGYASHGSIAIGRMPDLLLAQYGTWHHRLGPRSPLDHGHRSKAYLQRAQGPASGRLASERGRPIPSCGVVCATRWTDHAVDWPSLAGATRGAGRGIASALGKCGATVICTGRTNGSTRSEYDRNETIHETAEMVPQLGGTGIAAAVDHLEPDQVRTHAERIRDDYGHIDVLVNDIWGGDLLKAGPSEWHTPLWQHDLDKGLRNSEADEFVQPAFSQQALTGGISAQPAPAGRSPLRLPLS